MMSSLERDYIDKEPTETTFAEEEVIEDVLEIYEGDKGRSVRVGRAMHKSFLTNGLTNLPAQVGYLDASRPWLSYWMLNSMDLIGHLHTTPPNTLIPTPQAVVAFMRSCFTEVSPGCGSFGGGPAQIPHLAPTYSGMSRKGLRVDVCFFPFVSPDRFQIRACGKASPSSVLAYLWRHFLHF